MNQFLLFAVSGTLGFLVDSLTLYLLKGALGLYLARAVSFLAAVFFTWLFNRSLTFRSQRSGYSRTSEFGVYLALMSAGGSVNYLVYTLLVYYFPVVYAEPVLGVAAGSLAGLSVNWITSKYFLFRKSKLRSFSL